MKERTSRDPAPLRILAVDDSALARKLMRGRLLALGVELNDVRFAVDAEEALRLFTQWAPNLVLLDLELGGPIPQPPAGEGAEVGMDGDGLAKVLLERDPRLILVLVTAFDRDHPRVKALLAKGASDVVEKPVRAATLEELIARARSPTKPTRRGRNGDSGSPR